MNSFLRTESPAGYTPMQPQPLQSTPTGSFGHQLRQARQQLNLSIEDIAERTKLEPRQITALEEERFKDLPGMAFVRGFTRQYARVLKIDETPLLSLLPIATTQVHNTAAHLGIVVPRQGFDSRSQRIKKAFLGLALGASLIVGGFALLRYRTATPATPSTAQIYHSSVVITDQKIVPVPATHETAPVALQMPTAVVATKSNGHLTVNAASNLPTLIELSFEEHSWTEIKDAQGRVLLSQINQPGSRQSVKGLPPYDVTIGNPHAVTLQYKGVTLDTHPYTQNDTAHFTLD